MKKFFMKSTILTLVLSLLISVWVPQPVMAAALPRDIAHNNSVADEQASSNDEIVDDSKTLLDGSEGYTNTMDDNPVEDANVPSGVYAKLEEDLSRYLVYNGYNSTDELYVSQLIPVQELNINDQAVNTANTWIAFVLESDDTVVGQIDIWYDGETSASSFRLQNHNDISIAAQNGYEISLISYDTFLLLYTEKGLSDINRDADITEIVNLSDSIEQLDNLNSSIINTSLIHIQETADLYLSSMSASVSVPIVANDSVIYNKKNVGICWAAAVASIVNYRLSYSKDASDVFWDMVNEYPPATYGVPEGTKTWVNRALNFYGITHTTVDGGMTATSIRSALVACKPIYCHFSSDTAAHAVVLRKVYYSGSSGYYEFMDPNKTAYVQITIGEEQATDSSTFAYVSGSNVYSTWYYCKY